MYKTYPFNLKNYQYRSIGILSFIVLFLSSSLQAQSAYPEILVNKKIKKQHFLPDFSYAGYHFGEDKLPNQFEHSLNVQDFGAKADDGLDDSKAIIKALEKAEELEGYVAIEFPSGTFNISEIIYIRRSKTVVRGKGSGKNGTRLYFQRPLRFLPDPPQHEELAEYITRFDKRQRDPEDGLDAQFSQYSWSGAFLWVGKEGKLYKSYNIPEYNQPINQLAEATAGNQGEFEVEVKNPGQLKEGGIYKLCWYNKDGEEGSLLKHIYDNQDVEIGEHHWNNPDNPLVFQIVHVTGINKNTVTVKAPLLHDVKTEWSCSFVEWEHIEEVGIENFAFEFPMSNDFPHHLEDGYNAIYLTSLFNGWVNNVIVKNADSGILTDDISNVTIKNIRTYGDKTAHYSVAMGEVHNVLVENLRVENFVRHPLSFNTRSTRCVYTDCVVENAPLLDQHSAINEQNLFDEIKLYVDGPENENFKYRLFSLGGSLLWAPGHGAFSTFYNIDINFANVPNDLNTPITLVGTTGKVGVSARIIGVRANHPVKIDYEKNSYMEMTNSDDLPFSSLYHYQLKARRN
ncbi:MAG: glycosyl hydrolase family 28-related protein [Leeuwenhoekiella sp.]